MWWCSRDRWLFSPTRSTTPATPSPAIPLAAAFILGRRPATGRLTYGYGRAEDLAGLAVLAIILFSAIYAGYEAVQRLIHPSTPGYLAAVAIAGLVGFAGNEWVAIYRIRSGRRIGSAAQHLEEAIIHVDPPSAPGEDHHSRPAPARRVRCGRSRWGGAMTAGCLIELRPIGWVESSLVDREAAPKQGDEGSPEAWLVFSTRSADRPNPIGLHRVEIVSIEGTRVRVRDLEALDGTPILDVKPVLDRAADR